MVKCFKIKKNFGGEIITYLSEQDFLDRTHRIGKTQRYLLVPLKEVFSERKIKLRFKGSFEERHLQKVEHRGPKTLKDILNNIVPKDKIEFIHRSFDTVGDIAVLEIPPELKKLEKSIAWRLKQSHPNINVVAKKVGITSGKYRIRKIEVLAGEKRTETMHKEAGLKMYADLNKVYFSPRLGGERLRISKLIKSNEDVLVLFAGVGPQALVIAKQHPSSLVWAIELNPEAFKLMKKNIRVNYLGYQIIPIKGDVKTEIPKLKKKFDRIIMVLPHKDEKYLYQALSVAKTNAKIHMYAIAKEKEFS